MKNIYFIIIIISIIIIFIIIYQQNNMYYLNDNYYNNCNKNIKSIIKSFEKNLYVNLEKSNGSYYDFIKNYKYDKLLKHLKILMTFYNDNLDDRLKYQILKNNDNSYDYMYISNYKDLYRAVYMLQSYLKIVYPKNNNMNNLYDLVENCDKLLRMIEDIKAYNNYKITDNYFDPHDIIDLRHSLIRYSKFQQFHDIRRN